MDTSLKENINGMKRIIDNGMKNANLRKFGCKRRDIEWIDTPSMSRMYLFTNENIKYYLNLFNINPNSECLTVLASGDQVFNLAAKGITNIDSFDINCLTEYYALGIKRSMILKYSYQDFLINYKKLINPKINPIEINEIIRGLFPFMEYKHRLFWEQIIDYVHLYQKQNINSNYFLMLFFKFGKIDVLFNNNYYLDNETIYNSLKAQISNTNIYFKPFNAIFLNEYSNKLYNFINLSNVLDYFNYFFKNNWEYKVLNQYEILLENICCDNAEILLHYIFQFTNNKSYCIEPLIDRSKIDATFLTEEKLIKVPRTQKNKMDDGIIYKKVKK